MTLARKVAVNVSLFAVARAAQAVGGIVATVVATRYLGPDAFGALTVAIVVNALLLLANDIGLWTTATRELAQRAESERWILGNVLGLGSALSVLVVGIGVAVAFLGYGGADDANIRAGIVVLLAPILLAAPAGTALAWFNSRQRALPIAVGGIVSAVVLMAGVGIAYWLDLEFLGMAVVYSLALVANSLVPLVWAIRRLRRPAFDIRIWRQILRSALPQGMVLAVGVLYFRVDTLMLSLLSSDFQVALYGASYRVAEALTVLPTFLMFTLFPEIARARPHSEELESLVQSAFRSVLILLPPMLFVFIAFADPIIEVIAGPGYGDAVPVLQLLMVPLALGFVAAVYLHSLVALGRQARAAVLLTGVLAANIGLNVLLIPLWEARGAAVALLLSDVLALVLLLWTWRSVGARPRLVMGHRVLIATLAMAPALAVLLLPVHPLAVVAIGSAIALPSYVLALDRLDAMPPGLRELLTPVLGPPRHAAS